MKKLIFAALAVSISAMTANAENCHSRLPGLYDEQAKAFIDDCDGKSYPAPETQNFLNQLQANQTAQVDGSHLQCVNNSVAIRALQSWNPKAKGDQRAKTMFIEALNEKDLHNRLCKGPQSDMIFLFFNK